MPCLRPPAIVGHFYPDSKKAPGEKIEKIFPRLINPGETPQEGSDGDKVLEAIKLPSVYDFPDRVAAHLFNEFFERGYPKNSVISKPETSAPLWFGSTPQAKMAKEALESDKN